MLFHFYCDESYDTDSVTKELNCLTISGFLSDEETWSEVEEAWTRVNRRYGVSCFHASDANGRRGEYQGWDENKRNVYMAELLHVINAQGKRMVAYNCGIRARQYRRILSEDARKRMGEPWMVCFKACVAMIAKHMETLPDDDRVQVCVERGSGFDTRAVRRLDWMKHHVQFAYGFRLTSCRYANPEQVVPLQVADLMAYEYFRRLKDSGSIREMRRPLKLIRQYNHYEEGYMGRKYFWKYKTHIESAKGGPDEVVVVPVL
jgi:hypothetical protein